MTTTQSAVQQAWLPNLVGNQLSERRCEHHLSLLYKIINGLTAIPAASHLHLNTRNTRISNSLSLKLPICNMMPNRKGDPNCNGNKLNIGNDYVTIVYNDSGRDYELGTLSVRLCFCTLPKKCDFCEASDSCNFRTGQHLMSFQSIVFLPS